MENPNSTNSANSDEWSSNSRRPFATIRTVRTIRDYSLFGFSRHLQHQGKSLDILHNILHFRKLTFSWLRIDNKRMCPHIKSSILESPAFCCWHNYLVIGLSGVQFRDNRARNVKSLARLSPEFYATQSYYHHLLLAFFVCLFVFVCFFFFA